MTARSRPCLGQEQPPLQLGSERHPVGQAGEDVVVGELQQLVRVSLGPQHVFDTFTEHPPIYRLGVKIRCPDVVGAGDGLCIFGPSGSGCAHRRCTGAAGYMHRIRQCRHPAGPGPGPER